MSRSGTHQVLRRARRIAVLEPRRWHQGMPAHWLIDRAVRGLDASVVVRRRAYRALARAINPRTQLGSGGAEATILAWNDRPGRTLGQIVLMFGRALEMA